MRKPRRCSEPGMHEHSAAWPFIQAGQACRLLVQHFGVNTILTKISKTRFVPGPNGTGFFWDVHADFTAPQEVTARVHARMSPPRKRRAPHSGPILLPQWALVAWDDFSVVFLKRHEEGDDGKLVPIPGHSSIIEHHEFRVLKPNLPHNNYPVFVKPTPKLTAAFEEDLRRCREHMPEDGVW